jgi:hypothetical protein
MKKFSVLEINLMAKVLLVTLIAIKIDPFCRQRGFQNPFLSSYHLDDLSIKKRVFSISPHDGIVKALKPKKNLLILKVANDDKSHTSTKS